MTMERLKRLRQILQPTASQKAATKTNDMFDIDELRDLVSKGIPEDNRDAAGKANSDLLRPLAWRVLLGVVKGDPHGWAEHLQNHRADYQRWKRDLVGGTASRRGSGAVRTEAEHHSDIFLMKEIEKVRSLL
ncbi:unnamed protein product [Phytophthora lilii]|uniref:Unnamed protein product n=1 Tax=Phytophthora lilii TaxID=2077276 RepID=A0A9W6UBE1_9STRA|nr:unnamed protein product [Phytophthora lilii]